MLFRSNSATPKCKYYPDAMNVKAPAKPEISIDSARSNLMLKCFGDANGSIFTKVDPAQQLAAAYTFTSDKSGTILTGETKDSIKNKTAGNYRVIVRADVCSDTATVEIKQPIQLSATLDSSFVKCYLSSHWRWSTIFRPSTAHVCCTQLLRAIMCQIVDIVYKVSLTF